MTRRSSTMRRSDGRIRVRTDLPADVVAEAKRIAADTGAELEVVLGDLAAVALPGLFVEVADDLVSRAARERLTGVVLVPDAEAPPAPAEGVPSIESRQTNAERSLPLGLPPGVPGDGDT